MSIKDKKKLNKADYMFKDKEGETLTKNPGDINGIQFIIKDLNKCNVTLMDHIGQITIDRCTGCNFKMGPVKGSIFIRDSKDCTFDVLCQQFRCRDLFNSKVNLYVQEDPVIESSSGLSFGTNKFTYEKLEEHKIAAGFVANVENKWDKIFDYTKREDGVKNYTIQSGNEADKVSESPIYKEKQE